MKNKTLLGEPDCCGEQPIVVKAKYIEPAGTL